MVKMLLSQEATAPLSKVIRALPRQENRALLRKELRARCCPEIRALLRKDVRAWPTLEIRAWLSKGIRALPRKAVRARPPSEPTQDTKPASGASRSSVGTGGPHRIPQATPLRPLRLSGLNTPLSQAGTPTLKRQQRYFGDAKYEQEGDPSSFIYTSESTGLTYRFVLSHANRHPDSGHMVRLYKCERCQQWQETDEYHDVPLYTITTHDQRIVIHDPDLPHGLPHLCVQAEEAQAAGETRSNADSTSEETTQGSDNNAKRSPTDQQ
ncbi:hypothetical protein AAVH_22309 [Aphelenchoides avenae]|nr:hypothetical protein AAVH_22309 [Aphelenchus avenae]